MHVCARVCAPEIKHKQKKMSSLLTARHVPEIVASAQHKNVFDSKAEKERFEYIFERLVLRKEHSVRLLAVLVPGWKSSTSASVGIYRRGRFQFIRLFHNVFSNAHKSQYGSRPTLSEYVLHISPRLYADMHQQTVQKLVVKSEESMTGKSYIIAHFRNKKRVKIYSNPRFRGDGISRRVVKVTKSTIFVQRYDEKQALSTTLTHTQMMNNDDFISFRVYKVESHWRFNRFIVKEASGPDGVYFIRSPSTSALKKSTRKEIEKKVKESIDTSAIAKLISGYVL